MRTHNAEVAAPITQLFDDYGRYSDVFDDGVGRLLNGRRLIVTESRSSPEVLDFETSMCMRVFSRPFLRGSSIQFGTESFCEDVLPSRIAFLRASRIVVSNESYYFYRKNRRGQRTHFLCPTNGRIADVIRDCMHVGMEFITDDRQGGYFLLRLLRLVFWSRELIPLELADALQTRLVQEFRRSPSGWWRALRAMPECNRRMKRFADLNLVGAREQLLAKVFDTRPTPFADRVARKMMRRI